MESWFLVLLLGTVLLGLLLLNRRPLSRRDNAPAVTEMDAGEFDTTTRVAVAEAEESPSFEPPVPWPGAVMPVERLQEFEPLNLWTDEELTVLAHEHPSEIFAPGSVLFQKGQSVVWGYYLLRGEVELVPSSGMSYILRAPDRAARFPLGSGEYHRTDCVARSEIEVMRLPRDIALASGIAAKRHASGIDTAKMRIPPVLKGSSAFYVFCHTFESRQVHLPTLPSVALKLREAVRKQDIRLEAAAKIVQTDPVTAAKLIQVANSPLYFSSRRIATCQGAVIRMGLDATLNVIVSIGLRGLFRSRNEHINRLMRGIWQKSVHVSALAAVLATEVGSIEPDQALLAGLIYRIGAIPYLNFVEHLPQENYTGEEVEAAIPLLAGPVGKLVLTEWDFPEEYLDLPLLAEDWFADTGEAFNLSDLLQLAVWHSYLGDPLARHLPPIFSLPCYAKLQRADLTPEFSLRLLQKAKSQIDETSRLLMH